MVAGGRVRDTKQKKMKKPMALNVMICDRFSRGGVKSVLQLVAERHEEMNIVNLSTALQKIARYAKSYGADVKDDVGLHLLRVRTQTVLLAGLSTDLSTDPDSASWPRCLSTLAWVHSTLQLRDRIALDTMALIRDLASSIMDAFLPMELSNILWAFAKYHACPSEVLFNAAAKVIPGKGRSFTCSSLATIVWSFATQCPNCNHALLVMILNIFSEKLHSTENLVQPADISNMLWGLAKTNATVQWCEVELVLVVAVQLMPNFKIYELTITCWSISRLGLVADNFFMNVCELSRDCRQLREQLEPQGIANLMWGISKQVRLGSGIIDKLQFVPIYLASTCVRLLPHMKPIELGSLLWSLTQIGVRNGSSKQLDDVFVAATRMQINDLNCCADILGAFILFCQGHQTQSLFPCMEFRDRLACWCYHALSEPRRLDHGLLERLLSAVSLLEESNLKSRLTHALRTRLGKTNGNPETCRLEEGKQDQALVETSVVSNVRSARVEEHRDEPYYGKYVGDEDGVLLRLRHHIQSAMSCNDASQNYSHDERTFKAHQNPVSSRFDESLSIGHSFAMPPHSHDEYTAIAHKNPCSSGFDEPSSTCSGFDEPLSSRRPHIVDEYGAAARKNPYSSGFDDSFSTVHSFAMPPLSHDEYTGVAQKNPCNSEPLSFSSGFDESLSSRYSFTMPAPKLPLRHDDVMKEQPVLEAAVSLPMPSFLNKNSRTTTRSNVDNIDVTRKAPCEAYSSRRALRGMKLLQSSSFNVSMLEVGSSHSTVADTTLDSFQSFDSCSSSCQTGFEAHFDIQLPKVNLQVELQDYDTINFEDEFVWH